MSVYTFHHVFFFEQRWEGETLTTAVMHIYFVQEFFFYFLQLVSKGYAHKNF